MVLGVNGAQIDGSLAFRVLMHWPSDGGRDWRHLKGFLTCLSVNTVCWLDLIWGCRPEHLLMASLM